MHRLRLYRSHRSGSCSSVISPYFNNHPKRSKSSEYHQNLDQSFKVSLQKAKKDLTCCSPVLYCNGLLFVGLVGPLRMDHPSFHWRVPWDLERVEPCILWQGILLSPAKRPLPPATRLLGRHGRSSVSSLGGCWGCVEGERCLLPGSRAAQDMASEPRNIPPPLRNLLPGAPRSWALYQMVPTSYPAIWPSLAHHHVTPVWSSPLLSSSPCRERSSVCPALKQLCSLREILLTLVNKRIRNPLGKA